MTRIANLGGGMVEATDWQSAWMPCCRTTYPSAEADWTSVFSIYVPRGDGTSLVVDHEKAVRRTIQRVLTTLGAVGQGTELLPKPFTVVELASAVRRMSPPPPTP